MMMMIIIIIINMCTFTWTWCSLQLSAGVLMRSSRALMERASSSLSCVTAYLSVLAVQTKLHAVSVAVCTAVYNSSFSTCNRLNWLTHLRADCLEIAISCGSYAALRYVIAFKNKLGWTWFGWNAKVCSVSSSQLIDASINECFNSIRVAITMHSPLNVVPVVLGSF